MKSGIFIIFLLFSFMGVSTLHLPDFFQADSVVVNSFDETPDSSGDAEAIEREEIETEVILGQVSEMFHVPASIYSYQINYQDLISTYIFSIFIPPIF